MPDESQDARRPNMGPPFLRLSAWPYRLEMAMFSVFLVAILFGWRLIVVKDLDLFPTLFWLLWPDIGAFVPIGVSMRGGRDWPAWGSTLYNVTHTFLVCLPVIAIWSLLAAGIAWPLLGWALHIAADRAVGYYLRARPEPTPTS